MMQNQERLEQLFNTPRMGHAALEDHNSVRGLYELVKENFHSHFKIAEIGSFQGVSTMLFSMFVDTVYSIDCYDYVVPPTGRIPSHDQLFVDAEKLFLERTADIKNIIKIKKTSVEAAKEFEDSSLDAVYIDAEHDPISVRSDVNAWKNKVKKGGILCGHDFYLPHIYTILYKENLINNLVTYPDSSWSVIIK
jgi:predicted O-methyltransferase YrrM